MKDIFGGYTSHKFAHLPGDVIVGPNKYYPDIPYTRVYIF